MKLYHASPTAGLTVLRPSVTASQRMISRVPRRSCSSRASYTSGMGTSSSTGTSAEKYPESWAAAQKEEEK